MNPWFSYGRTRSESSPTLSSVPCGAVTLVDDKCDEPGLGEWDIRALVGHTSRSLLTEETYLASQAADVEIHSVTEYFRTITTAVSDTSIAAQGREAGAAPGVDPTAAVIEIVARVVPLIHAQDGSTLVTTIVGGMRLNDYIPTRTFKLAVHSADPVTALAVPSDVPTTVAEQSLSIVTELAIAGGHAGQLLLAATR